MKKFYRTAIYFIITKNEKHGACDITGKLVLEPISYSNPLYNENGFEIKNAEGKYVQTDITLPGHNPIAMCNKRPTTESDGFSWTELRTSDWKYGALDSNGSVIIPLGMDCIEYKPAKTKGVTGILE